MSTIDRYKKKGGFIQILSLIESSEPAKAQKFLDIISQESKVWAQAIIDKSLTVSKISHFEERALIEALGGLPATVMAVALKDEPKEVRDRILSSQSQTQQKKIENAESDNPEPRPGDIISCKIRLVTSTRQAITEGRIKMSSLPLDLQISENVETELSSANWSNALNQVTEPKATSSESQSPETKQEIAELSKKAQKLQTEIKSAQIELALVLEKLKKLGVKHG